jgi:hypothetical protein
MSLKALVHEFFGLLGVIEKAGASGPEFDVLDGNLLHHLFLIFSFITLSCFLSMISFFKDLDVIAGVIKQVLQRFLPGGNVALKGRNDRFGVERVRHACKRGLCLQIGLNKGSATKFSLRTVRIVRSENFGCNEDNKDLIAQNVIDITA